MRQFMFLAILLLGISSSSFAMDRGHGQMQRRDVPQRYDHRGNQWNENVYVNPSPGGYYYNQGLQNYDPFPDDAEADQIYQENLRN